MQNDIKQLQDHQSTLKNYLLPKGKKTQKRTSSQLSPSTEETTAKKVNTCTSSTASSMMANLSEGENNNLTMSTGTTLKTSDNKIDSTRNGTTDNQNASTSSLLDQAMLLKDIVGPLVTAVHELKDSI